MNPKKSNSGFLVVLLILVIGAYYFISVFQPGSGDYTYQQFMKDVKSDKVTAVTIKQNKEVPTGTITAEFGKDDYKSCEVTDVNQAINDIKKADSYLANKISIKGIDHSGDMISNLIGGSTTDRSCHIFHGYDDAPEWWRWRQDDGFWKKPC